MSDLDDDERAHRMMFSRRALILGGVQAAGLGILGLRFFNLQVVQEGRYAPLAEENRINLQVVAPKRGRILDRNGVELASNEEVFRAILIPALTADVKASLAQFRRIVPLTQEDAEKIARRAKKQNRNIAIPIASDLTYEQVAKINVFAPQLPGIRTEIGWRRRYRQGPAVGHIVGYTGSVERLSLDDDAVMRLPGARIGKSGIEAGQEAALRGRGGAQKIEVDARGRIVRTLENLDPVAGRDVALTIDVGLQRRVMERLQAERRASCVGIEIATGDVVVMASTPGYDPAEVAEGLSADAWQRLAGSAERPITNRAISGQYPPGSTFKMVTALAALQAKRVNTVERVTCTGRYVLGDTTFRCWNRSGHGAVNIHEALRSSCDVFFFEMARRLGIETLADVARLCGLGTAYDCGLSDPKAGLVPDPDWKRGRLIGGWLGGETILAGIGQGYMLTTPVQLAVMTARIASGKAVVPSLVKRGADSAAAAFESLGFDEAHLGAVRNGLIAVVNDDEGTGKNAALGPGMPRVAGKTGTSQVSGASSDRAQDALPWKLRDHALFVSYLPAAVPRYAFSAIVEHGGGGGAVAAPLVRDIMTMVLERDAAAPLGASGLGVAAPAAPGREG
jgi:penicillin-binding protein 2